MVNVRIIVLLAALIGISWFGVNSSASGRQLTQSFWDQFDDRPVRPVLFLGNSRTYYNDMPYMVRRIADSAGWPERLQVEMRAIPGASFERLWKDRETQQLLAAPGWSNVIVQGNSGAHVDEASRAIFHDYGVRLVERAKTSGSEPALVVGWNYGPQAFNDHPELEPSDYHDQIQSDYGELAGESGATLINVGGVWADIASGLPFSLYTDGNHPSLHGSYLYALMAYTHLAGSSDLSAVTYAPSGISDEHAALIRRRVQEAMSQRLF